jgi:FtsP/CotA-like multicopper oxidase with cupredoxin domain
MGIAGRKLKKSALYAALLAAGLSGNAYAEFFVQCGNAGQDANGDSVVDGANDPNDAIASDPASTESGYYYPDNTRCRHVTGGDAFMKMADADSTRMYFFGFHDVTGVPLEDIGDEGLLAGEQPGPTIIQDEGDEYYLTLSNVGMVLRPDLADPHTVHYHGFPNASDIFDGVPENTISINEGASLTYYYNVVEPGTFMYHCHVEATEHMQMGMLGSLYVRPKQNRLPDGTVLGTHVHSNPDNPDGNTPRNSDDPVDGDKYVYNDGDASTRYDVEFALQLGSFDHEFHNASESTQPLPFAEMKDTYAMINGRGYPDTVQAGPLPPLNTTSTPALDPEHMFGTETSTQPVDSLVTASAGEKILLRLSNLNVTRFYTVSTLGLPPMEIVGRGGRILRAGGEVDGQNLYFKTNTVTLGGGEAVEAIIDTSGVAPGTYYLYTTNLNYLSNSHEDFGGMMTAIVIN